MIFEIYIYIIFFMFNMNLNDLVAVGHNYNFLSSHI